MEEQLHAFLTYLQQEYQYSDNTVAAYRNDLGQFIDFLTHSSGSAISDWADVTEEDIEAYLAYMTHKDQPYASSTVARKVAAIKSLFNYLTSQSFIPDNPALDVDSPKVKKRMPRALSTEEVERLLDAPTQGYGPKNLRDVALLNVLYETGMRVTEVVSLQLTDFDPARSMVSSPTRQGHARHIPIGEATVNYLTVYLAEGRPHLARGGLDNAFFLNHRGEQLTRQGLWLIIKGYARQAGLRTEVTPHTLRHSFAVHKLTKGTRLEEIQHLLGHANISTTQIYTQMESTEERSP